MVIVAKQNSLTLTVKPCDSCSKTSSAVLFCHAHSAFFCLSCDSYVHGETNHARVWLCEVCENAPAAVTCKADAASLCAACDKDIHSANPLARKHDRVPVVPFYDSPPTHGNAEEEDSAATSRYLSDSEEAASWLLPNPNPKDELKPTEYLFSDDVDPYLDLDLDLMMGDQKPPHHQPQYVPSAAVATATDGIVPVVAGKVSKENNTNTICIAPFMVEGVPCNEDMDYALSKPFLVYNFNSQSITQSVSSSSLEVGVVPEHNNMADVSTTSLPPTSLGHDTIVPLSRIDREARVMRYREKRKNRKFEKTIRYASRKAYAETRPRIKGRFVKRTDAVDLDIFYNGVVPSF